MKLLILLILFTSSSFGQQLNLQDSIDYDITVKSYGVGTPLGHNVLELKSDSIFLRQDDDRFKFKLTQEKYKEVLAFINSANISYCEIPTTELICNGGHFMSLKIEWGTHRYYYYQDPCLNEGVPKECGGVEDAVNYLFRIAEESK